MSGARQRLARYRSRAQRLLDEPDALRDLLNRAQTKFGGAIDSSSGLRAIGDDLRLMVTLLRAWVAGEYRGISRPSVLSLAAALLYFVVPLDGIPDFLLGLGYVDDIAVLSFVIRQLRVELDAFRVWQAGATSTAPTSPEPQALPPPDSTAADRRCPPWVVGLALLLVLCSGGCSLKFAYNNADRLIRWGLDDFIEINGEQRSYLDGELDRLLYWHRTTQLPLYANYIERLNARVAAAAGQPPEVLLPAIEEFGEVAERWGKTIELEAQRVVLQMLLSLTEAQIEALPDRMRDANEEFAESELDRNLEESRKRWSEDYAKFFKRLTGRLTAEQRATLDRYAADYEPQYVLWMGYRERWQTDLLDILRKLRSSELSAAEAEARIIGMNDNRASYYGEFGPAFERNEALAQEAAAAVLVALTERQRAKLNKRVNEVTTILRELVEEAPLAGPAALQAEGCLVATPGCP
ncbi:MAG: DUF6279 family lipoprotein [Pseudomonadota bacterium]